VERVLHNRLIEIGLGQARIIQQSAQPLFLGQRGGIVIGN
jgi:hypothetical protein